MDTKISKDCLEHLVKGLNCHYGKQFSIEEKNGKFFIKKEGDSIDSVQLILSQKPGQTKFIIENFEDNRLESYIEILANFSPKIVEKFLEITLSDNMGCSFMSTIIEIICKVMKNS